MINTTRKEVDTVARNMFHKTEQRLHEAFGTGNPDVNWDDLAQHHQDRYISSAKDVVTAIRRHPGNIPNAVTQLSEAWCPTIDRSTVEGAMRRHYAKTRIEEALQALSA